MDNLSNLGPIMVFTLVGLRILAIPIGIVVFWLVRRMMPAVNAITIGILVGSVMGFVALFGLLRRFAWETVGLYDAAAIALVVTSALVFIITFSVKRFLAQTAPPPDAEDFAIWGESARERPKNLRRTKRR
jgi:hypothetical protein